MRKTREAQCLLQRLRNWLFSIYMLSSFDGARQQLSAHLCRSGIEKYGVVWIGERGFYVLRHARNAVAIRQLPHLFYIAPNQDRIRHDEISIRKRDASLIPYGQDGSHEVLVIAHASGNAVHDDSDRAGR